MPNRFLLVQLADIGDLILTTPAIAALREAHPDAHIALLTTAHSAPILKGTNLVDEIITFERRQFNSSKALLRPVNLRRIFALREGRYDTLIFFHHFTLKLGTLKFALIALAAGSQRRVGLDNGNGWFLTHRLSDEGFGAKHQAQYWLDLVKLVGAESAARGAVIGIEAKNLGDPLGRPYKRRIVIHAGGGGYSLARRWNPAGFAAVADALQAEYDAQIVLVGGVNDDSGAVKAAMKSEPVDLTGQTMLNQLAGVIAESDLFIGAESGVMHLAAAVGTPLVAIFGPGNPDAWGPWTPDGKSIVVSSAPECSPCSYVRHTVGLREGCPARTCIHMVTSEDVLVSARQILNDEPVGAHRRAPKHSFSRRIQILDLPVDGITYPEWLALIENWVNPMVNTGAGLRPAPTDAHHVCTINPEFMMIAQRDVNFFNILSRADLCVPDGVGLLWAAKYLGHPLPERVTGSDGVPIIAARAAEKGWRLFFLGAAPGVADQAAEILRARHPGLQIVGIYSGSPAPNEEDEIVARVNEAQADILFVAYGAPEQDKWIARNLPRLRVKMAMGVGGAFDFIAGVVPRAPLWIQRMGLEWLFRLYLQPWRFKRMLRLPLFVLAVLRRGR
jgi:N-acetylglucosaminyldiphosphoundecaprenol N-acetyl-beta-D-mannosaminyltransferase